VDVTAVVVIGAAERFRDLGRGGAASGGAASL
jgi:hypothetical protein